MWVLSCPNAWPSNSMSGHGFRIERGKHHWHGDKLGNVRALSIYQWSTGLHASASATGRMCSKASQDNEQQMELESGLHAWMPNAAAASPRTGLPWEGSLCSCVRRLAKVASR